MKANHNGNDLAEWLPMVVVNISSSKNESKSQLLLDSSVNFFVVVNISSSKNESKSQLTGTCILAVYRCCKYQ